MKGSWRRRCDARAKHTTARKAGKADPDWRNAFRLCRNWAVPGKTRCYLHGGKSTGPRTPAGKAASRAAGLSAMREGRRRRCAELALQDKKINTGHNGGRYPKDWLPEMRHRTPKLTTKQQLENLDATRRAERNEQKEIRRLLRTILRGSDAALSTRTRDPARRQDLIAKAREALPMLRQKWHGPK